MKKASQTNRRQTASKQHILVAVTGNTPQIVTETLYVMAIARKPPVPISAVYILTTAKGAEIAWSRLGGPDGAIAALQREYELGWEIAFSREHILVFKRRNEDGTETPLEDIRSSADNETLASELLGFVKALNSDPNVVLHCSLGGGRRTMSAYMMLALMMYGREDDELTHVVINEEFETNPDFFFPPRDNQPLPIRVDGGRKLAIINTSEARLEVAQIPFVRLRNTLGEDVGKVEKSLQELITIAQQRLDRSAPKKLVVDLPKGRVSFGTQEVILRGVKLALLAYYADAKINRCVEPALPVCGDCNKCFSDPVKDEEQFQNYYQRLYAGRDPKDAPKRKLESNLMSYHTKLNEALEPLSVKVVSQRVWGETTYGLSLDKNLIEPIA
ncbi:MAG TPA: CRISPR-associated ring nuclease Csm6 [Blastocatellia bacterium]|nr:CRISPR-associated ring nuclease Csm6 [Blastocatellia bacterium]